MSIELQIWPYIHTNINYTIRFVGYRIITRSVLLRVAISTLVAIESKPASSWGKIFTVPISVETKLATESIALTAPILALLQVESRPAPYWSKTFEEQISASATLETVQPTGLTNSEGNNLFIGNII